MPDTIQYRLIQHQNTSRIAIYFSFNKVWNDRVQKVPGAKWSKTLQCWHIPDTEENRKKCGLNAVIFTMNTVNERALSSNKNFASIQSIPISINNQLQLQKLTEQLKLKAYSSSTIKTYRNEFLQLLQLLHAYPAQDLKTNDLKRYLLMCIDKGLKENTIHSRLNALKFYYEQVLGKEKFFFEIPRPKKPILLPKLLNENELSRLFNAIRNKKHKAMLFTAYSAGLRVSEVVNLKLRDIDSKRMQIFIQRSKGKKDRYVNLSPVLLDILRQYVKLYKPTPKLYLFESEQTGTCYPTRTIQQIFSLAKEKAGINKEVGVHSLRHSFATHLLDKGTDIKYIKDILGHFSIKTTERYLHVSNKQLINIVSPFDNLWQKENIEW
jgi:site-specific recombinase XerD